ncbi:MAG: peptidoglycan-associated lipoprotein Pal [Alphaproteobacteria bacterium]|nr:peptidoglycan-associated lipoprotein Pal [Alphaproteobacteria bacterium]
MMKVSSKLGFVAVACSLLMVGACSTTKKEAADTTPPSVTQNNNSMTSSIVPGSAEDLRVNVGDTVHFDYDQYAVRGEDQGTLQRQAAWLQKYPQVRVTIEGHADERGTREYNLALGARRANAVKEYLVSLGVPSGRVDTISYGKERPVCTESDESCWAENRRGVTTITSGATS